VKDKVKPFVAWLILISALAARTSLAQEEPKYDTRTVGTYEGVVTAVGSHTGRRGNPRTRVTLKTKDGTIELHLGPTVFLDDKKLRLAEGDKITAIESRVRQESGGLIIVDRSPRQEGSQTAQRRRQASLPGAPQVSPRLLGAVLTASIKVTQASIAGWVSESLPTTSSISAGCWTRASLPRKARAMCPDEYYINDSH